MAFLFRTEDSLLPSPLVRVDNTLYEIIFQKVAVRAKPFLRKITMRVVRGGMSGTSLSFVGLGSVVPLGVEVRGIALSEEVATVCLTFPFWGSEKDQKKALETIKFQVKAEGFRVNHCGLETKVFLGGLDIEEIRHNNVNPENDNVQKYYQIKK